MKQTLLLTVISLLFIIPCAAQRNSQKSVSTPKAERFALIPYPDATEMSIRISRFVKVLRKKPTAKAYVIVYPGGEYQMEFAKAILRRSGEQLKENKIASSRIVLLEGGFREHNMAELFIVPKGAVPPIPTPTVDEKGATLKP